ncbi:glycopeptide [Thelephora ganbajun]|uniref:Glycopeptide n=1 Tax=Thelephora ganbajun TaxID=370292 RepID=A0ACB6ZMY1_THEGA|nr:glycopeptide [Thelephora ganbajun]
MLYRIFAVLAFVVAYVTAERHIVSFHNRCGHGTPTLVSQRGKILSTGAPYVSNGPLLGAIAYLQTGKCNLNGEHCTLVETTLTNPQCPGCGSSTDISLIPPHAFSVTTGFGYYHGCNGIGANCNNPSCITAFRAPEDNHVQVSCQENDVNLAVTFCM